MTEPFRNALRRGAALVCVLAVLAATSTPCLGLVVLMEGNQPVSHFNDAAWPGLLAVVNDPSRVLFAEGPVTQQTAFYQGNTTALGRILQAFAAVQMEKRVVILRPGRGDGWLSSGKASSYDWRLKVNQGNWASVPEELSKLVPQALPTITVFVGGGIDLERLRIPEGITLVGVDELRERYRQGLLSREKYVRQVAVHQLAEVDPYGKQSAAAVERLLTDEKLRKSAERALAVFQERAADPPDVRAKYENDERRIREFIFAWRRVAQRRGRDRCGGGSRVAGRNCRCRESKTCPSGGSAMRCAGDPRRPRG